MLIAELGDVSVGLISSHWDRLVLPAVHGEVVETVGSLDSVGAVELED